ncbi:unnamed protein product, partial [Didymodactylos carnosus]
MTLTCVPIFLTELYLEYFPFAIIFCQLWLIVDYSSIVCLGLLVCWASIQRHVLIFGPLNLRKSQKRLRFKIIPLLFSIAIPLTWYTILILGVTCFQEVKNKNTVNDSKRVCKPCFEENIFLFLIDTIFSLVVPLLITFIATFLLLIRIFVKRHRLSLS